MIPAIQLSNVSVRIGRATLLDDVSLEVHGGETVAIVGPNGAGKSTLMRVLSGDQAPHSGTASLFGREIATYPIDELAGRRAMLSQHIQATFPFSVEEIVAMGASGLAGEHLRPLVAAALREVELGPLADRDITTLSGGEQQRAHLARVLVQLARADRNGQQAVLLLDEPTSSLDLRHQLNLIATSRDRARGGTAVIAVLHDLNLAASFAERIVVLHRGRCVADGPPDRVISQDLLREVFEVERQEGRQSSSEILPQRLRAAARSGQDSNR